MNLIKITLILLISTISIHSSYSQTQAEMNKEAYADFHTSDDELNRVYKQIITEYKEDTVFLDALKKSQRIWIKFRDAELEMKYPNYQDLSHYGSIHPMCRAYYLKNLTDKRIETLKIWLVGIEEGDLCNGSVKIK